MHIKFGSENQIKTRVAWATVDGNISIELEESRCARVDWIQLAQNMFLNSFLQTR
jgi:hypothetical protein